MTILRKNQMKLEYFKELVKLQEKLMVEDNERVAILIREDISVILKLINTIL